VIRFATITPDESGYPWDYPAFHVNNYPTPGMFLDLNNRDGWFQAWQGYDVLVRAVLASALLLAGLDPEIAEATTSTARRLRQDTRALLVMSSWNVELYGCTNENYCGGSHPDKPGSAGQPAVVNHMMNNRGWGLSWMPRHPNNRLRMELGLPPQRTTSLRGEVLPGAAVRSRACIWIPSIDLDGLHEERPSIRALQIEPPDAIAVLGIHHPLALPGMPGFEQFEGDV